MVDKIIKSKIYCDKNSLSISFNGFLLPFGECIIDVTDSSDTYLTRRSSEECIKITTLAGDVFTIEYLEMFDGAGNTDIHTIALRDILALDASCTLSYVSEESNDFYFCNASIVGVDHQRVFSDVVIVSVCLVKDGDWNIRYDHLTSTL